MLSSTDSGAVNTFPNLSSTSSSFNPSLYINENDDGTNHHDIFPYHHQNPLSIPSLVPTNNDPINDTMLNMGAASDNANAITSKQEDIGGSALNGEQHHFFDSCNFLPAKKAVKKDRHSKIYTSQGLRDRRVRLSIEIARKFFDLQDMLGFDKASKTLEWLLTKSEKAIKDLAKNDGNGTGANSLSSSSTCEVVSENGDLEGIVISKGGADDACDEENMKKLEKAAANLIAKESRAKARARARERTRVKMCLGRGINPESNSPHILSPHYQAREKSGGSSSYYHTLTPSSSHSSLKIVAHQLGEPSSHSSIANQVPRRGNIIEESIVIKRKLKPSSMTGYQQNLVMLTDTSCNNNSNINSSNYSLNLAQNLDINGAIARSSFCALTNMNLSAGIQLHEKFWEAENN